jgi:hypothetical protein
VVKGVKAIFLGVQRGWGVTIESYGKLEISYINVDNFGGLPFCNVFPLLIVNRYVGFHFNAYHSLYLENFIFRKKMQVKKGKQDMIII